MSQGTAIFSFLRDKSKDTPIFSPNWKISLLTYSYAYLFFDFANFCSKRVIREQTLQRRLFWSSAGESAGCKYFPSHEVVLWDCFFEAFNSSKLVRIPVHCQLRKFMDSNENVQPEIGWNFCSGCCEHLIPFRMSLCNCLLDNFINVSIVNK